MIEAQQLTKRYGALTALDRVSFGVEKGTVAAFLGVNGAGKTTALRIISCFMPQTSGRVSVAGYDTIRHSARVRRLIGYLPEKVPLYDDLRVAEYLRYRGRLKGLGGRKLKERVRTVLGQLELDRRRDSIVRTLSKGLRQRVGLADALLAEPELLILDEPTSGLDPSQRQQMRALIQELAERHTVLLSTHILGEAEATCSHVLMIHGGVLQVSASLAELRGREARQRLVFTGAEAPTDLSAEIEVERRDETVVLRRAGRSGLEDLVPRIVAQGGVVRELTTEEPSLERLFLEVTMKGRAPA